MPSILSCSLVLVFLCDFLIVWLSDCVPVCLSVCLFVCLCACVLVYSACRSRFSLFQLFPAGCCCTQPLRPVLQKSTDFNMILSWREQEQIFNRWKSEDRPQQRGSYRWQVQNYLDIYLFQFHVNVLFHLPGGWVGHRGIMKQPECRSGWQFGSW